MLAGAVDAELSVHHRVQRPLTGLDQTSLLNIAVGAVEEVRAVVEDEISAVGFGIPALIDQRSGRAVIAVNLPLADIKAQLDQLKSSRSARDYFKHRLQRLRTLQMLVARARTNTESSK